MSKSKKNTKNSGSQNKQNSTQSCENNMSYATDKKTGSASDCHHDRSQNKNESNCQ